MTNNSPSLSDLPSILVALIDGHPSEEQLIRLQHLLADEPEALDYYRKYMRICAFLEFERSEVENVRCPQALDAMSTMEGQAPIVGVHPPSASPVLPVISVPLHNTIDSFSSGWPVAYLVATVIFGIGLVVGAIVHVSQPVQIVNHSISNNTSNPQSPIPNPLPKTSVGRITGMVDCVWEGTGDRDQGADSGQWPVVSGQKPSSHYPPATNHLVSLGDRLALRSGLLEITYNTGAKVILQGPVMYEVESKNGGFMWVGKLTGMVTTKAARGLTIRTPTAIVTDLGTEFGVEVSKEGNTVSHVFRGAVRLQTVSTDGKANGNAQVLHENESARVENRDKQGGNRIVMLRSDVKLADFVRSIPRQRIKTLDLVDIVAGGDGFSGRRDRGINPSNGRVTNMEVLNNPTFGDGKYHRVEGMPLVDGVFIPGGGGDSVQLDSAGHAFAEFPRTENTTSGLVFAGKEVGKGSELGGVDYNSPGHAMLAMHANKGVTFDLDAIRRANPGCKLLRFCGIAGITASTAIKTDNLLTNGNFTSGIDGWVSDSTTGSMAADTSSPDHHNMLLTSPYEGQYYVTSASIRQGQRYNLTFMAASPNRTATDGQIGSLVVRLWWVQGDNHGPIDGYYSVSAADLNSGWATYTTSWTVPAGHDGDHLILTFSTAGADVGEHYAIDKVALTLGQVQSSADFWVFVDGQARFKRRQINNDSGAMPAVVPIKDGDRFLTLAATDGGDGIGGDNTMFGDPRLELISVKAAVDSPTPRAQAKH